MTATQLGAEAQRGWTELRGHVKCKGHPAAELPGSWCGTVVKCGCWNLPSGQGPGSSLDSPVTLGESRQWGSVLSSLHDVWMRIIVHSSKGLREH